MTEPWTIRKILAWIREDFAGRSIPSPRLDAELVVAHALSFDRVKLYLDLDRPLVPAELETIRALVARRRKREPMAYLLGVREFYGRDMIVTRDVLIPRPDTETLVEQALAVLPTTPVRFLDLCTGSGCVAVTLLAERPHATAVATDLSAPALEIARRNAVAHAVDTRLTLAQGDLFAALDGATEPFDVLVANPPYLASSERDALEPDVRDYEPSLALFSSGADGLDMARAILAGVARHVRPGGHVLFEVGEGQGEGAARAFRGVGLEAVRVVRDLGGRDRVVVGARPA